MTETLIIDKLVHGGDALGRLPSGEVCFVPGALPGETVQIQLPDVKKAKGRKIAQLTAIEIPNADIRTEPPCSVFEQCGGCQWQHLTTPAQRDWKRQIVTETLQRIGKLPDVHANTTLPKDDSLAWHTRNHVQWYAQPAGDVLELGYRAANSHDLVPFDHCWIASEPINRLYQLLNRTLPVSTGVMRVLVRDNSSNELLLLLEGNKLNAPELHVFCSTILLPAWSAQQTSFALSIVIDADKPKRLAGQGWLNIDVAQKAFHVSAQSFFQVNLAAVPELLQQVQHCIPANLSTDATLVDLYAGVGLFGLSLAERFAGVTLIEGSASACADACQNAAAFGLDSVTVVEGDVTRVAANLDESFTVGIVDPPRAGCPAEVLAWINTHITDALIYVSCDPATLARDLQQLTQAGWQVRTIQPIDLFPQTFHIETVVGLTKISQ